MGEKCHRKKGGYGRDTFATCETKKREGGGKEGSSRDQSSSPV